MSKTAVLGILIAILLPLAGYFTVKYYSTRAMHMPGHYFYDDVRETSENGKKVSDTVWHRVSSVPFVNQLGKNVSFDAARKDTVNKILVVNFFFTTCPTICPGLARSMKKLQESFRKNSDIVQFISISIDPDRDSVPKLRAFADRFGADHDSWWFVRGDKQQTYRLAIDEMKANVADVGADTAFPHTENFFLLDRDRVIRGWYNGFDSVELAKLARDVPTLMLEKTKGSESVFRRFIPHLPYIFGGIGLIFIFILLLSRSKKRYA